MKRLIIIVLSVVAISAVVAGGLIADHTHEEGLWGIQAVQIAAAATQTAKQVITTVIIQSSRYKKAR